MSWVIRFLIRLLGRNIWRSLLSLLLATLLAFAFGALTVLRGIYAELYQNAEIKADFSNGLTYSRAMKIADSGYVREPFYECVVQDALLEMQEAEIVLTNRLDRRVREQVEWLDGWDEEKAMNTDEKVMVMYAHHAEKLGVKLGEEVRVNEFDWWNRISDYGRIKLEPGETPMDRRDKMRPFFRIVGIIPSENQSETVYISTDAWIRLTFLVPNLNLDIAEYILLDYHRAAEFREYAKGVIDKENNPVRFTMDTSYADRIYKIHQLIETLYPLTIAAALFLGAVLPGLTVLHGSRQISVLRALGAKVGRCVGIYTVGQVLCALAGLVLGFALAVWTQHAELSAAVRPFGIYLSAHLAACAVGSSVFAWLCARKRVLEQLQAKE